MVFSDPFISQEACYGVDAFALFEFDYSQLASYPSIQLFCLLLYRCQFVVVTPAAYVGVEFIYRLSESAAPVSASDFADSLLEFRHLLLAYS